MSYTYTIDNTILNGSMAGGSSAGVIYDSSSGTYTIANGGSGGPVYTTTGTSGSWINTTTTPYDSVLTFKPDPASLEVKGRMVINGVDLEERLNTIEKVLQIPERDVKLETKHPKLKELYDAYIHALGKYRTWDAIKGEDND